MQHLLNLPTRALQLTTLWTGASVAKFCAPSPASQEMEHPPSWKSNEPPSTRQQLPEVSPTEQLRGATSIAVAHAAATIVAAQIQCFPLI